MQTRVPTIENHGPVSSHDQACAVLHTKSAVLDMDTGVFHPSQEAQKDGWAIIRATSAFQRLIARIIFGVNSTN